MGLGLLPCQQPTTHGASQASGNKKALLPGRGKQPMETKNVYMQFLLACVLVSNNKKKILTSVCSLSMNFINNHKDITGLHNHYKGATISQHIYCLPRYLRSKVLWQRAA